MAPSAGTLRVGRYFAVLLGLFVVLYGIVFWPHQPRTPKLGLDLEGGAQVILKAQTSNGKAPSKSAMDQARQIITNRVNGLGVSSAEVVTQGNDRIVVSVPGASANDIKNVGGTALLQFRPLLTDAVPVTAPSTATGSASASPSATAKPSGSSTAKATAKPSATAKPASTSPSPHGRVVPLAAGSTTPASPQPSASTTPSTTTSRDPSAPIDQWKIVGIDWCAAGLTAPPTGSKCTPATPDAVAALATSNPTESQQLQTAIQSWPCNNITKPLDVPSKPIITCNQANNTKYLLGPVIVAGTEVKSAAARPPGSTQGQFQWTVTVDLKPKGQAAWASYTAKHNVTISTSDIGNQVADTLDSKVIVASTIQSTITGTTEITGNFTGSEATNLANSLKYGALPLNFTQQDATSVSPTLGTDQLKAGLLAGGIGLALVIVYSLVYYRALGLVTIASLATSGGLTYAMLVILGKQIGFTLTLAGIAGFIVAVGITADSFVVFFERIKDEVHEGRTARTAVPRAWLRARRTILSADTVSFLAAATLYYFAAGDVKGFAFTLGLSTILDLVVVFLFTHPLVSLFSRSSAFGSARFTGLDHMRAGGIATRDPVPAGAELVTVGAGVATTAPARPEPAASKPAASKPAPSKPARRPANGRAPAKPSTSGPVVGTTAAERAASRRGLKRPDTETKDDDR
ncbi:MAG TPA: protein translocase subunit SecD [Jatrophihabitans sp.]|nr:protein translocase subunit SecD [Jatrophihabitans sp.]